MNSLINITTNEQGSQVVDARELHKVLEVTREFSKWIKSNLVDSPFFEENVDYVLIAKISDGGKFGSIDYAITLDTAYQITSKQIKTERTVALLNALNKDNIIFKLEQQRKETVFLTIFLS